MNEIQPCIAFFLGYLGGGGAERVMLNLAYGFTKQNQQVDLVLGKAWGSHLKKVPSELHVVDLKASGLFATLWALVRYLREKRPIALISALHYTNEIALLATYLARVSTQVIVTEHNTLSQTLQCQTKLKKRLIPLFVRHFYPRAHKIITVSQGVAQDLTQTTGLSIKLTRAIYNPVVSPELFEKANVPLDHPWFAPEEPPVILGVGKLETQKDFPNLIRAFAQVRQTHPARLIILGWGPQRPELEALIKELGLENEVQLSGYIENPYSYMANAAVFVLSSAWEGLPTVLIEAMAVGTPVVSTDCKSGPAEILNNGKYGFLAPVGNSEILAQGILKILSGESIKVEPTWLKQFTLEIVTQQYLDLIHFS